MAFVMLGVVLIALKLLDIGPPGVWSWWIVLFPFALAVVWWAWADMSGFTQRAEMDKMEEKKLARRRKAMSALGLDPRALDKKQAQAAKYKALQQRKAEEIEGKRDAERKKVRDSVINSRFDSSVNGRLDDGGSRPTDGNR